VRKPRKAKSQAIPEWMLQAAFIAELHALEAEGWPITCAGDMNAGRLLVEIKPHDKKLSEDQEKRHKRLRDLGHNVTTVYLRDPQEARTTARSLVTAWVTLGGWI
jgi:hypothetical protein